jgi:HAMP domain-containing protein
VIVALWIGLGVALGAVVFLAFVLAGALRSMDDLRARLADVEAAGPTDPPGRGLSVGAPAPPIEDVGRGGGVDSPPLSGVRHLVAFADPDCAACARLVPDLLRESPLPGVVVSDAADVPPTWRAPVDGRIAVVVDGRSIAERYRADVRPHVFVVDEGGSIVASAPAGTLDEVRGLVDEAAGVRIVGAPPEPAHG